MRHNCFYQTILVALMTLWSFAAHSQIVINYQALDSTQITYENSQFDITPVGKSYEINGLDISKVNYITRFKTANTKEGHVTLPEGAPMAVNTLTVMGGQDNVPVDKQGFFSIPSSNIMVLNSDGKIVYTALISLENEQRMLGIEVNATETALALLLPLFTNPAVGTTDEILLRLKKLIAELPATQALAEVIDRSIVDYGYLDMNEIDAAYDEAVDQLVQKTNLDSFISEVKESRTKARAQINTHKAKDVVGEPQRVGDLVFELTKQPEMVKINLKDDIVNAQRNNVDAAKMTMRIYNTNRFAYTAIMEGRNVNGTIKPVSNSFWEQIKYMVPPQRVSNFVNTFTTWEGLADFAYDNWRWMTEEDFKITDMHFADTKLEDVELYVTTSDDVVLIQGPIGNMNVLLYNIFRIIFSEVLSGMAEAAKEFDGVRNVDTFTSKFLDNLASDDDFMAAFTKIANSGDTQKMKNIAIFELIFPKLLEALTTNVDIFLEDSGRSAFRLVCNKAGEILKTKELLLLDQVKKWGDRTMALFGLSEDANYLEYHGIESLPPAKTVEEAFKQEGRKEHTTRIYKAGEGSLYISISGKEYKPGEPIVMSTNEETTIRMTAIPADGWMFGCLSEYYMGQERNVYDSRVGYDMVNSLYVLRYQPGYCLNDIFTFYFRALYKETLTFSAGRNGTLTASHWGQPLKSGDEVVDTALVTFTAKPDRGYKLKNWIMGAHVWKAGPVLQTSIDDREVIAEFEEDPEYDYTKDPEYDPKKTDHLAVESQIVNGVIEKNSSGTIIISSGSGLYKASSSNEIAFTTELRDNVVTVYAVRSGYSEVITITDLVTGETQTVNVSSENQKLKLSESYLEINEGEVATIEITKGSGSYQLVDGNNQYAKADISSNIIRIEGLKQGTATITLKDVYQSEAVEISVSIKESNLKLGSNSVSLNLGSSTKVCILKGSGNYSVQSSSITIQANIEGPYVVISASGNSSGYVTVTDNETSARQTISVSVDVNEGTVFWATNEDGLQIMFTVISVEELTCAVGALTPIAQNGQSAISKKTQGVVRIPEIVNGFTVTSILRSAFKECSNITSVIIPSSVNDIGTYAFQNCSSLTSVDIPKSVTSIGGLSFANCSKLTSLKIPDSITYIGPGAFSGCSSLTSITLPSSLTTISTGAFSSCSSLTSVTIEDGVTNIGPYAFSACKNLISVTLPNSITSLNATFLKCTSLKSIEIPSSVISLDNTFNGCESLETVIIPDGVKEIRGGAFYGCISLTSITLPHSLEKIIWDYQGAFDCCDNLEKIVFHCPVINDWFRRNRTIKTIIFGDEVEIIGESSFYYFSNLTTIEFGKGLKRINRGAFSNCDNLLSLVLPDGLEVIDYKAFSCSGLTTLTIPSSVNYIGERAFEDVPLQSVTSLIENPFINLGKDAFEDSSGAILYVPKGTKKQYKDSDWAKYFFTITQIGGDPQDPLQLAASEVSLVAGADDYMVEITSGNGDYTVTSSNDQVATASMKTEEEKDWLVIVPHNAGEATITVTDNASDQQQTVTVKVSQVAKGECLTFMVNGSPVDIVLSEHPIITYTNNTLHVKTAAKTVDIPVKDISGGKLNTK